MTKFYIKKLFLTFSSRDIRRSQIHNKGPELIELEPESPLKANSLSEDLKVECFNFTFIAI